VSAQTSDSIRSSRCVQAFLLILLASPGPSFRLLPIIIVLLNRLRFCTDSSGKSSKRPSIHLTCTCCSPAHILERPHVAAAVQLETSRRSVSCLFRRCESILHELHSGTKCQWNITLAVELLLPQKLSRMTVDLGLNIADLHLLQVQVHLLAVL